MKTSMGGSGSEIEASSENEESKNPRSSGQRDQNIGTNNPAIQQPVAFDNNSITNCSETMSDEEGSSLPAAPGRATRLQPTSTMTAPPDAGQSQLATRQVPPSGEARRWSPGCETESGGENTTLSLNSFTGFGACLSSSDQQLPPSYRTVCNSTRQLDGPDPPPDSSGPQPMGAADFKHPPIGSACPRLDSLGGPPKSGPAQQQVVPPQPEGWISVDLNAPIGSREGIGNHLSLVQQLRQHPDNNRANSNNNFNGQPQTKQPAKLMMKKENNNIQRQFYDGQTASLFVGGGGGGGGNLPINHVISAEGSIRHQWQANQYYAGSASSAGNNDYVTHQQIYLAASPQCSLGPSSQNQGAPGATQPQPGSSHSQAASVSYGTDAAGEEFSGALAGNQSSRPNNFLGRQSRATTLERTKQRKRRRHKSATSGRCANDKHQQPQQTKSSLQRPDDDDANGEGKGWSHRQLPQSISAHCWLIDSSDDQVSMRRQSRPTVTLDRCRPQKASHHKSASAVTLPNSALVGHGHLTVAMMRQSEQKQQQQRRSETLDFRKLHLANGAKSNHTNSLKMHRTNRPIGQASSGATPPTIRQVSASGRVSSSPSSAPSQSSLSSSSSASSSSRCCQQGVRRESSATNAGVIMRLSAILSMASRLVRKPARRSYSADRNRSAEPSHISGSSSAPYTAAGSLAISSSSSTSAYATGSQSSSATNKQRQQQRLIQLNVINHSQQQQPPISLANLQAARGPLYGPASTSGPASSLAGLSSHAYEYCDDLDGMIGGGGGGGAPAAIDETQFTGSGHNDLQVPESSSCCSSNSDSRPSTNNSINNKTDKLRPLPSQSDHELISAGSLDRCYRSADPDPAGFGLLSRASISAVLPETVCRRAGHSSARNRWRWVRFGYWLRRPCTGSQEDLNLPSSEATAAAQGIIPSQQQTAEAIAASYKSLKSISDRRRRPRRTIGHSANSNARTTTISDVISLAKADRAFRLRLLASIVVSCILLALVCLLAAIVYSRSASGFMLQNRHKLNLLVDDSDYDLSWLWPQTYASSSSSSMRQQQIASDLFAYKQLLELESQQQLSTSHQRPTGNDNSLRRHLLMIEESERLEQFQLTLAHLTSIQLANDQFIDIIQLIDNSMQRPTMQQTPNTTTTDQTYRLHLNQKQADLVYVTLLSNLHWPLVKWRHQNQQSVASFLSAFAPTSSYPNNQSLRNLLSLLMLANRKQQSSDRDLNSPEAVLMKQIARLNNLLSQVSNQMIRCIKTRTSEAGGNQLGRRFCQKLIRRYRRLMQVLSQLNHSHLAKLQTPSNIIELNRRVLFPANTNQRANTKTLIGYFLDRLALLDVQLIVEEILASADPSLIGRLSTGRSSTNIWDDDNDAIVKKLIDEFILANESTDNESEPTGLPPFVNEEEDQTSKSLFEMAKLIVGDSPANSNIDFKQNKELQSRLQQLEQDDQKSWHKLATDGILFPWSSKHLPLSLVTNADYDLFLHPNLSTKFVQGMVKLEFRVKRASRFLVINCAHLNLADISLWHKKDNSSSSHIDQDFTTQANLREIPIRRVLNNANLEQLYIELQDQLEPHSTWTNVADTSGVSFGELSISMSGRAQSQASIRLQNIYVLSVSFNKTSLMMSDKYESDNKQEPLRFVHYGDYFAQTEAEIKTILYSQFEPTNARRLFPCFDEPKFRARFQLNLVHQSNHQAISNGAKRERIPYTSDGSLQMSVFEPTQIPLSTYLVSFMIFDLNNFKSVASRISQSGTKRPSSKGLNQSSMNQQRHIQVQVLAQFEHLDQTEFVASLAPQLLNFYQSYLQLAYPSEKLDLVAVPEPLASSLRVGGNRRSTSKNGRYALHYERDHLDTVENFGLIWFRAPLILVDTNLISQDLIEQTSMTLAHQIAHQYFGNIIAISDWMAKDLWLYEALCQYLESLALSRVQADWRLEEQFPVPTIQESLESEQYYPRQGIHPGGSGGGGGGGGSQLGSSTDVQPQPLDLLQQQYSDGRPDEMNKDETIQGSPESFQANLDNPQHQPPNRREADGGEHLHLDPGQRLQQDPSSLALGHLQPSDVEDLPMEADLESFNRAHKRNSAILHMFLFNLLPSQEAQGRFLRSCLNRFYSKTMSLSQFWHQFGHRLQQEVALADRLALDASRLFTKSASAEPQDHPHLSAGILLDQSGSSPASGQQTNNAERIVFVRKQSQPTESGPNQHQFRASSGEEATDSFSQIQESFQISDRLSADNLELVANMWLEKSGYPLISVTVYRDRIHLKQERFSFNWWMADKLSMANNYLENNTDLSADSDERNNASVVIVNEDVWWPIPLMFVSRYNPRLARFFWMQDKEMDIPYGDQSGYEAGGAHYADGGSLPVAGHQQQDRRLMSQPGWFKLNVNQSSLVRVNYDERQWSSLAELLIKSHYSNHILSPLDRANLIDDALTLMRCAKLSVGLTMNLTLYLEVGERDFMPWTVALKHLDQMQTVLNQNPLWHRYVLRLLQPISSIIGWKDDGPHLMRKLRRHLFSVALQYGDEKAITKAKQEFKAWTKSGRFIVPNLQELVYVAGVRYGDQQEWFHCWQKYQQLARSIDPAAPMSSDQERPEHHRPGTARHPSSVDVSATNSAQRQSVVGLAASPFAGIVDDANLAGGSDQMANVESEKQQLLTALASTQNTWLIEQFLNYSLDPTKIEQYHLKHIIRVLGKNPVARLYLWRFVRLNWFNLLETFTTSSNQGYMPPDHQILETMLIESTRHFATKLDYDEVKTFFDSKKKRHKSDAKWTGSLELAMQQSLQIIQSNMHWRNTVEPKLTSWLSHFGGP